MTYKDAHAYMTKRAYNIGDPSHPDNVSANKAIGAITGGAFGGLTGYGVGAALSNSKTVRLLSALTGAGLFGYGGYALGDALTDKWADRDAAIKALRNGISRTYGLAIKQMFGGRNYRDNARREGASIESEFNDAIHNAGYSMVTPQRFELLPGYRERN